MFFSISLFISIIILFFLLQKKEFIAALGLVSRDSLSDIKNKKLERKRRSTANPQFSNAALEEKWKNAAAAQAAAPPQKRPRGLFWIGYVMCLQNTKCHEYVSCIYVCLSSVFKTVNLVMWYI